MILKSKNQPTNQNFLSPLSFKFTISKLPHVSFFVQTVKLPNISLPPIEMETPYKNLPFIGDKLIFSDFQITFLVDEDMKNYNEIFNWLSGVAFPESYDQYKQIKERSVVKNDGLSSDASLIITTSSMNPNIEIVFTRAFPSSLSEIIMNTMDQTVDYVTATASFRYDLMKLKTI